MARDSLFGESIVWRGQCRAVSVPFGNKVVSFVAAAVSVVTLGYAVVAAKSLHAPVGGMVLFAAWCATVALGAWRLPLWWRSQIEYIITERHVIWRRGPIRRSIDRAQISYALVRWSPRDPTLGDLVIIRAVPTGALRRTLSLTLHDVDAPSRKLHDVFLVLDGPQARAMAPSGAFGTEDKDDALRPVFSAIADAETVGAILKKAA